jgi:hypothetical protein
MDANQRVLGYALTQLGNGPAATLHPPWAETFRRTQVLIPRIRLAALGFLKLKAE